MTTIRNRFTGAIIVEGKGSVKELIKKNMNLPRANLYEANLYGANLSGAKIEFHKFPSIRLLSSMPLGRLSDNLTLELMRRDAFGHPKPELFDAWANGKECPYKTEERLWHFTEVKGLWKPGNPEMTDRDLIIAICREKGWGIKGYLKAKVNP